MEEKFIKLTVKEDDLKLDEVNTIFINLNHVSLFFTNDEGFTEISFLRNSDKILVKESVDEIMEMINDEDYQKEIADEIMKMLYNDDLQKELDGEAVEVVKNEDYKKK